MQYPKISAEWKTFTIALNGILKRIETLVEKCFYVDDLALFYSARSISMIKQYMKVAIDMVVKNTRSIGFTFSATKTTCVHFYCL